MTNHDYDAYIASKQRVCANAGFEPLPITAPLFDWQKQLVEWAVRKGRCALFEDCGLGKTAQQLEWAHQVAQHTGGSVLVLTFTGIGSEGVGAVSKGRRFVGSELKASYAAQAVVNLRSVTDQGLLQML